MYGKPLDWDFKIVKKLQYAAEPCADCHRKSLAHFEWLKVTFTSRVFFQNSPDGLVPQGSDSWVPKFRGIYKLAPELGGKDRGLGRIFSQRSCVFSFQHTACLCSVIWSAATLQGWKLHLLFCSVSPFRVFGVLWSYTGNLLPSTSSVSGLELSHRTCPCAGLAELCLTCLFSQMHPLYLIQTDLISLTCTMRIGVNVFPSCFTGKYWE